VAAVVGTGSAGAALPLPPPDPVALLNPNSLDALSGNLRGYLVRSLPDPLYKASPGWGTTKSVARGVVWRGQGLHVHPEVQGSSKNDGTWRKVRVRADDLADTLVLDLRHVQFPEPGRMTFDVFLSFDAHIDYDHQEWERGRKLYDGSTRARLRLKLALACEATARLEANGSVLPDAVVRLRAAGAALTYDNLVVGHVAGVGGEAAKVIGDALQGGLRQWRPSLERELLAKADAAIVKAADTKEVRVNLATLLGKKGRPAGPAPDPRPGRRP
jgi:hypothetical protein